MEYNLLLLEKEAHIQICLQILADPKYSLQEVVVYSIELFMYNHHLENSWKSSTKS